MNTYELYNSMSKVRNQYKTSYHKFYHERFDNILLQMLDCTFRNEQKKDELPSLFRITTILTSRDIETLMKDIGLTVSVKCLCPGVSLGSGLTYQITQI